MESSPRLGYDALTIGPPELRLGEELLRSVVGDPTRPFVTTNLRDSSGERLAAPSRLVEKGSVTFGVASMVPRSDSVAFAEVGWKVTDPDSELPPVLKELRASADIVVLLARVPLREAQAFAERHPGLIDVVVIGTGEPGRGETGPEHGGALFVQTGNRGQAVGEARFQGDEKGAYPVSAEEVVLHTNDPEDPEIKKMVDAFEGNLNTFLKEHQVRAVQEKRSSDGEYYLGANECAECHLREYEIWLETPHSSAFATLVDKGREALPECFTCHVTGAKDPAGYDPTLAEGRALIHVQCEVCHGKGSAHARDGSYGRELMMNGCVECHDAANSPDFDSEVYWLMIEH